MIINFVPGEECRIAILEEGRLEEFYAEREAADMHVGNIYLGKVVNVESAIQAAFIDFGIGRNGFLHVSDLHPMYFPGSKREETEPVGKKTPHRNRPPIQQCLKRGQEVLVQVIKEGIGTKGPTLTSYLSIPGRYLVMMPYMERLGVSRRVEDIDTRREMRQQLDALDLPDNFGFILRTAGLNRNKTELKRDLAYLQRLWKAIEKKRKSTKGPAELYAESDLLLRTMRDVLSPSVNRIVVDNRKALRRIDEFLRIATPRSRRVKLVHYAEPTPVFHTFGIEQQIRQMNSREVPLPSGGSLVIDSTEAMVAIDVNSGKMRQYSDAETTAYKTNLEAVDELARQLRLRDLGGLILIDLIDMRASKHQREVENRFKEHLKRDRAKTETLRLSRFGIMEMTRQRMRPGLGKTHYTDCPTCMGRGRIKTAEATAADGLHDLATLLDLDQVARVEMVVGIGVASVLLSRKRQWIVDLEEKSGKTVDIRVSQSIAVDRVDFYAYDERNADIDLKSVLEKTPGKSPGAIIDRLIKAEVERDKTAAASKTSETLAKPVEEPEVDDDFDDEDEAEAEENRGGRRRRRRRSRGGRGRKKDGGPAREDAKKDDSKETEVTPTGGDAAAAEDSDEAPRKKKRRSRRRGRRTKEEASNDDKAAAKTAAPDARSDPDDGSNAGDDDDAESSKNRGRRTGREKKSDPDSGVKEMNDDSKASEEAEVESAESESTTKKRKRRGRRGGRGRGKKSKTSEAVSESESSTKAEATKTPANTGEMAKDEPKSVTAEAKPEAPSKPAPVVETKNAATGDEADSSAGGSKRRRRPLYRGSHRKLGPSAKN